MINTKENNFINYIIIAFVIVIIYYVFNKLNHNYEHLSEITTSQSAWSGSIESESVDSETQTNTQMGIQMGKININVDGSLKIGQNVLINKDGSCQVGLIKIDSNGLITSDAHNKTNLYDQIDVQMLPPITNGLIAMYDYTSLSNDKKILNDLVGSNHATIVGDITTKGMVVSGTINTSVFFPDAILPLNYTLFHLAKYNNSQNKRAIFQNSNSNLNVINWGSGFANQSIGVAIRNSNYITNNTSGIGLNNDQWIISSDQYNLYRANGTNYKTSLTNLTNQKIILAINPKQNDKFSDFDFKCIIVYDRELTLDEIVSVEKWIYDIYRGF